MKKIQGQYGASEIEIVDHSKGVIVWVWDKQTVSDTIGRYSLQKTYVAPFRLQRKLPHPRLLRKER
jgi:hypothetical protein